MKEHDIQKSVVLARFQLSTLRSRLERVGTPPGSSEVQQALGDLQTLLETLQSRYELLRQVLERSSDAVFAKDLQGRYVIINASGARMFGKSVEEIVGKDDEELFGRECAARIKAIDRAVMTTGKTEIFEDTLLVGGVTTSLLTTETAWYEPEGRLRGLIGSTRDVTERRRSESRAEARQDRLRSLAAELVLAEERLRQSLAEELHKGLGQDIALTKLKLSALRGSPGADLHAPLSRIEQLVEQTDHSLHSITLQLSPPALHDLGLVPALEWLAEDVTSQDGFVVRVEDPERTTVPDDRTRVLLFRAVRELLINAVTHARARLATVTVGTVQRQVQVVVEDDGIGFDPSRVEAEGYGLFGIREQLRHAGGSMSIDSAPGRGTRVSMRLPLASGSPAS